MQSLGIPTANLSEDAIGSSLSDAVTGIYYGWASKGQDPTSYMMVMSIGYNPFYGNTKKTCEPWLLHTFDNVRSC
jgi:riboflavin kinase